MEDDYSAEVAEQTRVWFNYRGKFSWEMSRYELAECALEMIEHQRIERERHSKDMDMLYGIIKSKPKQSFLARLFA